MNHLTKTDSESEIEFESGGAELLNSIEAMWLKLKAFHIDQFPTWSESLQSGNFQDRQAGLREIADSGAILVEIAHNKDHHIGFCVTTITNEGVGEIASLFVEQEARQQGLGTSFVDRSLRWLHDHKVETIVVDVMAGNTTALHMYQQAGFQSRVQHLQFVKQASDSNPVRSTGPLSRARQGCDHS